MSRSPIRENVDLTFSSNGNPSLIYISTDQRAYMLDDGELPADERELAILRTLLRLGSRYASNELSRMSGTE